LISFSQTRLDQAVDESGRVSHARSGEGESRNQLMALAYNMRRAFNILGVEAMMAAVAA
jgi:hypothetical protein